ncbi:ribosomal RNA small subunit methyltransferase G [Spirochaetia bacterium]|nr:ribosomal RNA small subunit methyltransferase G [Spirochaetia bacterium]GHU34702.1 ribosomal RNA small subunit methyltransferase G [Spirochaetia bacterium]
MSDSLLMQGLIQIFSPEIVPELLVSKLESYLNEIERFNPVYGLISVDNHEALITRHILDSLAPLNIISGIISDSARIADVGSGAGLPGIPLALCLPGCSLCLIERSGRRAAFLRTCVAALSLDNVTICEEQLEHYLPHSFNLVAFRALRHMDERLLHFLFRILAPGGVLVAYKGRMNTITAEMSVLESYCTWEAVPVETPFLPEERHLVVIRPATSEKKMGTDLL